MKTEINVKRFLEAWKSLVSDYVHPDGEFVKDFLKKYNKDKEWTKFLLGKQEYGKDSPLGNHLISYFNNQIGCRKEYNKLDLILAKPEFFEFESILNTPKKENYGFYPKIFEIIIEHENNIEGCWQEMAKLAAIRAKLKVLITYNKAQKDGKNYADVLESIQQNFAAIIQQSNEELPEIEKTQYL